MSSRPRIFADHPLTGAEKQARALARHPFGRCLPSCQRTHGNEGHYQVGCRCRPCRDAHADYRRAGRRLGKGDAPPPVKFPRY